MTEYPDGVWETTGGLTDDEARLDWPVLRDAPGWQRVVTGPSGRRWEWRPWPRFPMENTRHLAVNTASSDPETESDDPVRRPRSCVKYGRGGRI